MYDEYWQLILDLIALEISTVNFNTWFKDIKLVNLSENKITLSTKHSHIKDILSTHYYKLIKRATNQILNKEFEFEFELSEDETQFNQSIKPFIHDNGFRNNVSKFVIQNPLDVKSTLNYKYTFEGFVVGNNNRIAHAAAVAISESPGDSYNPFFIYGGVGLGKTHLIQAVAHYILDKNPNTKVLYTSSEIFTNELIHSIQDNKNSDFREKYRNIDVLIIDDIQFIGGKEKTQEEFFHTFNALYEAKKQIIISSDKPPKKIQDLEPRLRSRFECGLITDVEDPDFETRIAILKKKSEVENLFLPTDVLIFIANSIDSNIRELEGALNKILAFSSLVNKQIDLNLAQEALYNVVLPIESQKLISVEYILSAVCEYFNLQIEDLLSTSKIKSINYPRQLSMYLCRKLTSLSLPKIAENFGRKDHTTILYAYDKIKKEKKKNLSVVRDLYAIENKIIK
ncbi:chromosomal replication initiation protein DnaA [Candidatus Epulonipiscium fishelsonii]|uniref:Chromosomal replication initiation protein DnaA n=1 Tax=Candidatus Epulonipiscium fishelsonii TaxID=77094 RepID=A0ACC8X6X8_9FIRM|nr:chromosomal replication initiation protein DnaA [Epulopiscium sp. SCG-B11WGA-EpuloA1]ONI41478.1 chromosomal replication initiation protein DnaA [Epulopiscium sp. SCG-B05WGA-EpuloA1]